MLANERFPAPHIVAVLALTSLVAFLALAGSASAAAPPNDNFANAVVLPEQLPAEVNGSTVDATVEPGERFTDPSVWYRWTAPTDESVSLDVCRQTTFAPDLAILVGRTLNTLTPLRSVAFGAECPVAGIAVSFEATAGTSYAFRVSNRGGDSGGFGLDATGYLTIGTTQTAIGDATQTQPFRLNRSEHPGTCQRPNLPPLFKGPEEARPYAIVPIAPTLISDPACMRIEADAPTCTAAASSFLMAAYGGPFDPAHIDAGLVAAASSDSPAEEGFDLPVGPGSPRSLILSEIAPEGNCSGVTVTFRANRPWASSRPTVLAGGADVGNGPVSAGAPLAVRAASWAGTSSSLGLRWQSCDPAGAGCVDLAGAVGPTFTPGPNLIGRALRVVDTASNPFLASVSSSPSLLTGPVIPTAGPIPSETFQFGKLVRDPRHGSAQLSILVPGPGALRLSGKGVAGSTRTAKRAGTVTLLVRAKGASLAKLRKAGRVKVKIAVSFAPRGDKPVSALRTIELRLAPRPRR